MVATVLIIAAYICGSLPTGVWLGRYAGVDVRQGGSGNIGATNVARTVGLRPAFLTLIGDITKGLVPAVVARALLMDQRLIALAALAAFFGHIFSMFLRFSGGKGVATGFGAFLGLAPGAAGVAALVFAVTALMTRYVSLASMLAAASLPVASAMLGGAPPICGAAMVVGATIIIRHRDNLARLLRGMEPKFRIKS
ncbi:MAG: glycerol-3-phosphate 1-O-acyltransferase PlsY [Candidatus Binatia bacterium]